MNDQTDPRDFGPPVTSVSDLGDRFRAALDGCTTAGEILAELRCMGSHVVPTIMDQEAKTGMDLFVLATYEAIARLDADHPDDEGGHVTDAIEATPCRCDVPGAAAYLGNDLAELLRQSREETRRRAAAAVREALGVDGTDTQVGGYL